MRYRTAVIFGDLIPDDTITMTLIEVVSIVTYHYCEVVCRCACVSAARLATRASLRQHLASESLKQWLAFELAFQGSSVTEMARISFVFPCTAEG